LTNAFGVNWYSDDEKDDTQGARLPGTARPRPRVITMRCQLKGCGKCGGDLVLDIEDWRCWQCGRYYYPERSPWELLLDPAESQHPLGIQDEEPERKRRKATRSRRINSVIAATDRSENRWWVRNQQVIVYLDQGKTIRDIAETVGADPRQIRIIRERLYDLRANALEALAAA
jgi:hypothetical protein